ncbi:LysE family translocator [Chelatococcus sp. GCM10030263]|uniref:LysE family translocator n=1 Tax=Chelatococcus sp. GCM10030263 TaxID=3273387 RepID=UPI00360F51A3
MPSTDLLVAFALATLAFAAFPGPALLYTAAQTLARGRRAGFMAVLGIHVGCYVHVVAATLGLSAILRHVPEAYVALKIAGAIYLVWLGISMVRRKDDDQALGVVAPKSARRAFIESVIVEVLNPKVALFFLAFLPQFVDPAASAPVWLQFLVLGIIVNFTFSSADIVTVFAASTIMRRLSASSLGQRIVRYLGGSILVGLGLKLATDRN